MQYDLTPVRSDACTHLSISIFVARLPILSPVQSSLSPGRPVVEGSISPAYPRTICLEKCQRVIRLEKATYRL